MTRTPASLGDGMFYHGHDGADGAAPSHAPSNGHIGRASSFDKATEDKDARHSLGDGMFYHGHDGADGAAPSHAPSHGHIGRASSFAKATEGKDARPILRQHVSLGSSSHSSPASIQPR